MLNLTLVSPQQLLNKFERDKLQALEGTVTSYREIIEDLEKQLANAQGVDHEQLMAGTNVSKQNA